MDSVRDDAATGGLCSVPECGPGKVLTGLVKRINRDASCIALEDPVALTNAVKECSVVRNLASCVGHRRESGSVPRSQARLPMQGWLS